MLFSEEDAEYNEALRMGPICAIVLEGGKDAKVGMVMFESPCMELIVWQSPIAITITGFLP
jgi:hypothetical protein